MISSSGENLVMGNVVRIGRRKMGELAQMSLDRAVSLVLNPAAVPIPGVILGTRGNQAYGL